MDTEVDTFLVAGYTEIDTRLQTTLAPVHPVRPGPRPTMADSEVLTLLLIGQWRGSSERALLRGAASQLPAYFPVLLSQSAFNRRVRLVGPLCVPLMLALAELLAGPTRPYQVVDTTAVLLAVAADGPITGFVLGPANTQDRWLLDALLTWRVPPEGQPWTVTDIPRRHRRGGGGSARAGAERDRDARASG